MSGKDSSPQQDPDDLVLVKEAARDTGIPIIRIYRWIKRGELAAQRTPSGLVVSLSAVRRLVAALSASSLTPVPLPPLAEEEANAWVHVVEAATVTGVKRATIHAWARKGLLPTQQGRHGRMVRPEDVQAIARRHFRTRGRDETQE